MLKMKKFYLLFALIGLFVLQGCPQPDPGEDPVLTPIKTDYTIGAEGGEMSIPFKTNQAYQVKSSASWLTVSTPTKAVTTETVKVTAAANSSTNERSARLTITAGTLSATVTVTQEGRSEDPYLEITPTSKSVPAAGETFDVTVNTNQENVTSKSSDSWVTVSGKTVTVAENTGGEERTATVTFSAGSLKATLNITQSASEAVEEVLEPKGSKTYSVPAEGKDITVTVRSNVKYDISLNGCDWITQTKATTVEEYQHVFHVLANEGEARTATISFTYDESLTFSVTVSQDAYTPPVEEPYIEPEKTEVPVAAESSTATLAVDANCEYDAECDDDWLTITGKGAELTFEVAANPSTIARQTQIILSYEWVQVFVNVVQQGGSEDENPFDVGSNLSVNGTANCYVVTKAGNFSFDASVMGNGPDGFLWDETRATDALLWPKGAARHP